MKVKADFFSKDMNALGQFIRKYGLVAGPLFNITFIMYVLVTDIVLVGSYAWVSLGMPLGLSCAFVGVFGVAIFNINRHWVRWIITIFGLVYIFIAISLPYLWGGNFANYLHSIIRFIGMSPWYSTWDRSGIYSILSWLSIFCYGVTTLGTILCEVKNPFRKDYRRAARKPGKLFTKIFGSNKPRTPGRNLQCAKSLIFLISCVIMSGVFITGNQLWFAPTFTMEYDADMLDDLRLEYWVGVDEQFHNGSFPVLNSTPGYVAGDNASINISSLMSLPDPFHAAQVYINYTFTNLSNIYAGMIHWSHRLRYWTANWSIQTDNSTLELVNINANMATLLNASVMGTGNITLLLEGYKDSRLTALGTMHGAIAMSRSDWMVYGNLAGDYYFPDYSAWDRITWLFYNYGIQIQSYFGLDPFLLKFEDYAPRLRGIQKARLEGPYYWRATLEGHMYNVERGGEERRQATLEYWDELGWNLTQEYNYEAYGINESLNDKNTFFMEVWARNSMNDALYSENARKWRDLFDEMKNTTLPNGTTDPTAYFKQINCGTTDSLLDIMDGDTDDAIYNRYLGSELPWDVAGYMFYRGNDEAYWTYGFSKLLVSKPLNHPLEEKMVYLGCVGQGCYSADEYDESNIRGKPAGGSIFMQDFNYDGMINGFDSLVFDIMMVRTTGVKRINLWPGAGPRSTCCDYREFPRELISGQTNNNDTHDFFVQMVQVLSQDWSLEFDVVPGQEHYWDKHFTDILMDFQRPKGLLVLAIFGGLFYALTLYQRSWDAKKARLIQIKREESPV
ncbi:MAG: hypothetical protein ACFFCS_04335 [Candidatus Hodarchaeota archaeon]